MNRVVANPACWATLLMASCCFLASCRFRSQTDLGRYIRDNGCAVVEVHDGGCSFETLPGGTELGACVYSNRIENGLVVGSSMTQYAKLEAKVLLMCELTCDLPHRNGQLRVELADEGFWRGKALLFESYVWHFEERDPRFEELSLRNRASGGDSVEGWAFVVPRDTEFPVVLTIPLTMAERWDSIQGNSTSSQFRYQSWAGRRRPGSPAEDP